MFGIFRRKPKKPESPSLFLYNTKKKDTEAFSPLTPGKATIYSCGPTVYDTAHIGNLRAYIFSDILRRTLEYNNYQVKHIINITDIGHLTSDADEGEDKMVAALKREGKPLTLESMKELADRYAADFKEDLEKLNVKPPLAFPMASEHIGEQIALIKTLEEKGYAYELSDGVYFDTSTFPAYGVLGGIAKDDGGEARVVHAEGKRSPHDFALWKKDRSLGWESPWGMGFPGWHIECSAMSMKYLGRQIDIHTGGTDHIAIHHNNEIAQSEAATGKTFVRYWMHSAFLTIDGQKISKSLGNTLSLYNLEDRGYPPFAFRYLLLTGHYRSQMNFTWEALDGAYRALVRLHKTFLDLGETNGRIHAGYQERFREAINDDLDTPKAVALMWELVDDDTVAKRDKRVTLLDMNKIFGIGLIESYTEMKKTLMGATRRIPVSEAPEEVRQLVSERDQAREGKDWEAADSLRDKIAEKGFTVTDTPEGPELHERS